MFNSGSKGNKRENDVGKFADNVYYEVHLSRLSRGAFDRELLRVYCNLHRRPLCKSAHSQITPHDELTTYRCCVFSFGALSQGSRSLGIPATHVNCGKDATHSGCELVREHRYIQVKSNQWRMSGERFLLELLHAATVPLPDGASREYWRVRDHPSKPLDPRQHIQARLILGTIPAGPQFHQLPAGVCASSEVKGRHVLWKAHPLLPEWSEDGPSGQPDLWAGLVIFGKKKGA